MQDRHPRSINLVQTMPFSHLISSTLSSSSRPLAATAAMLVLLTTNSCKDSTEQASVEQTEEIDTTYIHQNNLNSTKSSLLQSQSQSQINWQPWSKNIFAAAEAEKKTVFAFIGSGTDPYALSCLEQLNQSQSACDTLNTHHVNILIDSNLHPDLEFFTASLCLRSGTSVSKPLLVWLSYEGTPVSWIPIAQNQSLNIAEFITRTSNTVSQMWMDSPDYVIKNSREDFSRRLTSSVPTPVKDNDPDNPSITPVQATRRAASLFDPTSSTIDGTGGLSFARYVKLMTASSFRTDISETQRKHYLGIAEQVADSMILYGLIDPLDGGIYSGNQQTTAALPVFSKELNAQAYAMDALYSLYKASGKTRFLKAADAILAYTEQNLLLPDGSYSLGIIYAGHSAKNNPCTWTLEELEAALSPDEMKICTLAFGIKGLGNIPMEDDRDRSYFRKNTLTWKTTPTELAAKISATPADLQTKLDSITKKLAKLRKEKSPATRQEKLSTSGATARLASAYSTAYHATGDAKHLKRSTELLTFIRDHFIDDSSNFSHARFNGKHLDLPALGIDYALITQAALDRHEAAPDPAWLQCAEKAHQKMATLLSNTKNYQIMETTGDNDPQAYHIYQFFTIRALDNSNTWALTYSNAKRLAAEKPTKELQAQSKALRNILLNSLNMAPFSGIDFLTSDAKLQQTKQQ